MSAGGEAPAVDLDLARQLARDCGWTLVQLGSSYLRGTRRQIGELRQAIEDGEAAEIRRLGHSGLGSSLSCGVSRMAGLFRQMELAGEAGQLGELPELVDRAEAELERVARAFGLDAADRPAEPVT